MSSAGGRRPGRVFILSAPSGAGKSSLARALVERRGNLVISVSHTTRAPRPGEQDGVDYFFVDRDRFEAMVRQDRFLEHARVFDNHYGTARSSIEDQLAAGNDVLLDIDWQGARSVRSRLPGVSSIFILPPSRAELERRLRGRGQDSDEVIARRMRDAESEMSHYQEFETVVVNDDFDAALADIEAILDDRPGEVRPNRLNMAELLGENG